MDDTEIDALVASSEFGPDIAEALEDGDHALAADLYAKLVERHPDHEALALREIGSLGRCYAWAKADRRAKRAVDRFPGSITAAAVFARVPVDAHDWQVAVDRCEWLRARFDPRIHIEAAATFIDQFFCYEQMADAVRARAFVERHWPDIRRRKASAYGMRGEFFELGAFVPPDQQAAYGEWSAEVMPPEARPCYLHRIGTAAWNRRWLARHAPDVALVSLGQNCLPWVLPNRWGLRPNDVTMRPFAPFDYLASTDDVASTLIERDFAPLLDQEMQRPTLLPQKIPILVSPQLNTMFFHERGAWWAEEDWSRLRETYRQRADRFRTVRRTGKRLFFHCLCGKGDLERLVRAYETHLDDRHARLLIVNVLKEPVALATSSPRVVMRHIPYPEDYNWNAWFDIESMRGLLFELEVVKALRHEMAQLKDWRTVVRRARSTGFGKASRGSPRIPMPEGASA